MRAGGQPQPQPLRQPRGWGGARPRLPRAQPTDGRALAPGPGGRRQPLLGGCEIREPGRCYGFFGFWFVLVFFSPPRRIPVCACRYGRCVAADGEKREG